MALTDPPPVVRLGGRWSDQEVDRVLGWLLRAGVLLSATIVAIGAVLYVYRYWSDTPAYGHFHGEPYDLRHVRGIFAAVVERRGRGVIQLGLLVLIATPVVRVAAALLAFVLQRDWT